MTDKQFNRAKQIEKQVAALNNHISIYSGEFIPTSIKLVDRHGNSGGDQLGISSIEVEDLFKDFKSKAIKRLEGRKNKLLVEFNKL